MVYGKRHQWFLWICIFGVVLSSCQPGGPSKEKDTIEEQVVVTEVVEVEGVEMVVTRVVTVEEEVDPATATPPPQPTDSPTTEPEDTPTPEVLRLTKEQEDALNDCLHSDGTPADCAGYDIGGVMWGIAQNGDDLSIINLEAEEAGYVPLETPVSIEYPFIYIGIRINNMDPDVAYYCIHWTHQHPTSVPVDPTGDVLSSCYNHQYEFSYNNTFGPSGELGVETDSPSTQISFDPSIGVSFGQVWGSIFEPFPEGWADVLGFTHEGSQWDKLRVETAVLLTEQ